MINYLIPTNNNNMWSNKFSRCTRRFLVKITKTDDDYNDDGDSSDDEVDDDVEGKTS